MPSFRHEFNKNSSLEFVDFEFLSNSTKILVMAVNLANNDFLSNS
jgi:hypothetical protein